MSDALEMFRAMRNGLNAPGAEMGSGQQDIRPAGNHAVETVGGSVDLHDLAMVPGSAAYRARIPKPPCYQCGEDHFPGRPYDHEWTPEPPPIHDEPVSATAVMHRPSPTATILDVQPTSSRRVALYVGRNDTYVVAVEAAPDWDTVISFKVPSELVLPLVSLARALDVKVADKTGGDLFMLEEEDARQHAQAYDRGSAGAGDHQPRRQEPAADRQEEDQPDDTASPDGGVPGGRRERRHSPRPAER
jgi:hypothetical protein